MQVDQKTQVQSLGWENPLEESMATHSSIFAWKTPWTKEPGQLQFIGSHRVRHQWSGTCAAFKTRNNDKRGSTAKVLVAQLCPTLCDPMDYNPPGSSVHGDSPDKNTEKGCHVQGIFPTQGSNPGLPHCRQILYRLSHKRGIQNLWPVQDKY